MRYLLLSVLVVCMIGIMIPSVFSDHYGYYNQDHDPITPIIVATNKTTYDIGDTIFIAGSTEGRSSDPYVELSIYQTDCEPKCHSYYDTVRVWVEEVKVPHSGKFTASVNINSSWKHIGTYTLVADYFTEEDYATFTVIDSVAAAAEAKAAAERKAELEKAVVDYKAAEAAAEAKAAAELKALFPPGVVTEGYSYNFGTKFERDTLMSVKSAYEDWGFPQKNYGFSYSDIGVDAKIISGSEQDLLVYNDFIDNIEGTWVIAVEPSKFSMYDGKDRKFSNISYSTITQFEGEVKNPNFSWDEDCTGHSLDVQPGLTGDLKVCFVIPKNSDHFKITYTGEQYSGGKYYDDSFLLAIFDRAYLQDNQASMGGGCLIATAAFGSEMAPQVQFLRELRDNTVLQTESGTSFMTGFNQFYYSFSPVVADYERENPVFKEAVKLTLTPLLTSLTLLQYTDIDSESEMLGYGIGVILLNIGMYFVAPAALLSVCIRKISRYNQK